MNFVCAFRTPPDTFVSYRTYTYNVPGTCILYSNSIVGSYGPVGAIVHLYPRYCNTCKRDRDP